MTRQGTFKYLAFILFAFIVMGAPGLIQAECLSGATPVGYWQLNEATGATSFVDSSATDGNGTCTNCPLEDTDGVMNNKNGQIFDGSNDEIIVTANDAYDFTSGSLSIEVWVKTTTNPGAGNIDVIVGSNSGGNNTWWVGVVGSGGSTATAGFNLRDSAGNRVEITGTTDLLDGEWHHIVATRDASAGTDGTNSLYVDGVLDATGSIAYTGNFATDVDVSIGAYAGNNNFDGSIDEVAIYNGALTKAIIDQHALNIALDSGYCDDLAPQILTTSTDAALGAELFWTVQSAGNPFPTFALGSDAPLGMDIDASSGQISWPPLDSASSAAFDTTASNGVGSPDTEQLTINLVDLCSSANLKGFWKLDEANGATSFDDFSATDANGTCTNCPSEDTDGQLSSAQTFDGSNAEIIVAANDAFDFTSGSFSVEVWVKTTTNPGAGNVDVIVGSNSGGNNTWWVGVVGSAGSTATAGFNLRDSAGNRVEISGATDLLDGGWHHIVAVRDASVGTNGSNLLYVDNVLEATGSIAYTGTLNTDADVNIASFGGSFNFNGSIDEVAIYDRAMTATMVSQHFMLAQSYCNTKPVINAISAGPATEDSEFTFTLSATDADGDTDFLWSLTDAPTGMTVAETTGVVTWTPTSETTSGEVTATVADSVGGTDTETFTIAVNNVNDAPVISTTGPTTATVGEDYTYDADATDEDAGDTQTWSKVSGPDDLAIDSASGLVTWTPTSDDSATTNVTIRVTDGDGLSDSEDIVITVSGGSSSSGGGGSSGCFIGSLK